MKSLSVSFFGNLYVNEWGVRLDRETIDDVLIKALVGDIPNGETQSALVRMNITVEPVKGLGLNVEVGEE